MSLCDWVIMAMSITRWSMANKKNNNDNNDQENLN